MTTLTLKRPSTRRPAPTRPSKPFTKDQLKAARAWLREQLPDQGAPFVIGIREQLQAIRPPDIPEPALRVALRERVTSQDYLISMLVAGHRQGIGGKAEPIDEQHRMHAAERLLRLQADGVLDKAGKKDAAQRGGAEKSRSNNNQGGRRHEKA